jgi:FkbM family methyltransferase
VRNTDQAWRTVQSDYGLIVIHANDTHIGRSIVRYGYWMQEEVRLMLAMLETLIALRGEITCYDVGANIGTHTLAIGSRLRGRVTVKAFEAQATLYRMLCETVAINSLERVRCFHNAVADVAGIDLQFAPPDYAREANFGSLELMPTAMSDNAGLVRGSVEHVRTVNVDALDERVDFIKLDIEGMETRALRGARRTIAKHRPLLLIETLKSNMSELHSFLGDRQYRVRTLGDNWIAIPQELAAAYALS